MSNLGGHNRETPLVATFADLLRETEVLETGMASLLANHPFATESLLEKPYSNSKEVSTRGHYFNTANEYMRNR